MVASVFRFIAVLLCFGVSSRVVNAQVFENSAGEMDRKFLYEVKQIDEFFERFNDDTASFIRKMYRSYRVKFNIERQQLIKSLFNYQSAAWRQTLIDSFVRAAMSVQMPSRNNFYGDKWYAEVLCKFDYNSEEIEIPVVLRVVTDDMKRSKWVMCGVKNSPVKFARGNVGKNAITDDERFISPASHANYFIELARVFDDKEHLAVYFDNSIATRANTSGFYQAIVQSKLKYLSVKSIKYHFLQVSNYIFTVEYFDRKDLNSGWLINRMKPSTDSEKELFTRNLLGE